MQFWPPDDEHMYSKHVEAWNKTYCETEFFASSWLNTEMHGQQNIKISDGLSVKRSLGKTNEYCSTLNVSTNFRLNIRYRQFLL